MGLRTRFSFTTLAIRLLRDRLGSASAVVSVDGTAAQTQGYYPWGETRFGSLETEYQYTGQYRLAALGLDYFNARWYDPMLGRWTSPDTIVPDPGNPADFDRYSYVRNNPVRYNDPTGHKPLGCTADNIEDCSDHEIFRRYGVKLKGEGWNDKRWGYYYRLAVIMGLISMGEAFSEELGNGMSPVDAFREVFDEEVNVTWGLEGAGLGCKMITGGACVTSSKQINFLSMSTPGGWRNFTMALRSARNHVVHEFGHAFASRYGDSPEGPYRNIPSILIKSPRGFASSPMSANLTWRQNPEKSASEVFADMFLGWVFDMWAADSFGDMRDDFMTERMPNWLIY